MTNTVESLSILGLIGAASPLVQAVMLVLVVASVVSWIFILWRAGHLRNDLRSLRDFEQRFRSSNDLDSVQGAGHSPVEQIFQAGYREYCQLSRHGGVAADAVIEGTQRALRMAIAREEERLDQALPFLATVGSTSPYIGLFGTVWGIMHSFIGLSGNQQSTLAAVAPGIAEALIATAIGLFAAIPAVIAYNRLSARAETLLNRYFTFADEILNLLHRRVHMAGR